MLVPRQTKFRKQMRGRMTGKESRGVRLHYGEYGLQALQPAWISSKQLEAARKAMVRSIKRGGKIWIMVYPDKPVTKKPAEVRMGSGKGNPEFWVCVIRPGRILFEMTGVPKDIAIESLKLASDKLPIKTRIIEKGEHVKG
jgi:large subunit ribosomal protein L16